MATYKGNGGSITFAASAIAEVLGWSISAEVAIIDDTVLGDAWETKLAGTAKWSGKANFYLDYADTAQSAMLGDIFAVTPSGDSVAGVFLVTTGKTLAGNMIVQSVNINLEKDAVVSGDVTFVGNGQLVFAWA